MTAGTPFPLEGHLIALRGKRPLYALPHNLVMCRARWTNEDARRPKPPIPVKTATSISCQFCQFMLIWPTLVKPVKTGTASRQKVSQVIPEWQGMSRRQTHNLTSGMDKDVRASLAPCADWIDPLLPVATVRIREGRGDLTSTEYRQ